MQSAPTQEDGQQSGDAATLARGAVVEHAVDCGGSALLVIEFLPAVLFLFTVGHVGLGTAIGALHAINLFLSAILFPALRAIVDVHILIHLMVDNYIY